jgi:IclR family transcriptional regulator, pca regulon regulatory protein
VATVFVSSLARGLRVLQALAQDGRPLTLSEVAAHHDLTPSTARRSLHTLVALGFVAHRRGLFFVRPKVLAMGAGYLKALNAEAILDQPIQALVRQAGGSAAVAVLDEFDVLYVAHVTVDRTIRLSAAPGARQPACSTPIGHVLLAFQPQDLITRHLRRRREQHGREEPTRNSASFERGLELVRTKGYAAESDESDGIVSVALPIFDRQGRIIAAASCSDVAPRSHRESFIKSRLPLLRSAVHRIEAMLAQYPTQTMLLESPGPRL